MRTPAGLRSRRYYDDSNPQSCWEWQGCRNRTGYGEISRDPGGSGLAHRVVYEDRVGPIPEGAQLDHLCRVRCCVNPAHLEPVTPLVNTLRGEPANRTHCPQGHPYDERNTLPRKRDGRRECRACAAARIARRRAAGLEQPESTCTNCGVVSGFSARGLCRRCYTNDYRRRKGATGRPGRIRQSAKEV